MQVSEPKLVQHLALVLRFVAVAEEAWQRWYAAAAFPGYKHLLAESEADGPDLVWATGVAENE